MNTADLPLIQNPDTLWDVDAVTHYLSASKSWVYKAAERGAPQVTFAQLFEW